MFGIITLIIINYTPHPLQIMIFEDFIIAPHQRTVLPGLGVTK